MTLTAERLADTLDDFTREASRIAEQAHENGFSKLDPSEWPEWARKELEHLEARMAAYDTDVPTDLKAAAGRIHDRRLAADALADAMGVR